MQYLLQNRTLVFGIQLAVKIINIFLCDGINIRTKEEITMLRSAKSILGYTIRATDGDIGKTHDIYFDDDEWVVRYLVADTGSWLSSHKVLLFPIAAAQPDWTRHLIPVGLSKDFIEKSPPADNEKPVSKQHEIQMHAYFNWAPYWPATGVPYGSIWPPMTENDKARLLHEPEDGDAHLRSVREVTGYGIQASDGDIGHVEDFILDDAGWDIRFMVVDTRDWLPGRKVLIAPPWIETVRWSSREVAVNLPRETVKNSPEYDPSEPVNEGYELQLYDYYGRPRVCV